MDNGFVLQRPRPSWQLLPQASFETFLYENYLFSMHVMSKKRICLLAFGSASFSAHLHACHGFAGRSFYSNELRQKREALTRRNNFFKSLIDKAFENDSELINASDKRTGQLDDSKTDELQAAAPSPTLTATQAKWREAQQSPPTVEVAGTTISMDFYVTGVPERDPSNDLYASKTTISSRDRSTGLTLPTQPTVSNVCIEFMQNGACNCLTESPLTRANSRGDWMYLDENKQSPQSSSADQQTSTNIRFRIPVTGYSRTVETKGTIQNVYWSKRNDDQDPEIRKTSTTYSIPEGFMYGDATLVTRKNARGQGQLIVSSGILKIEQTTGFLGAATKLVPCGKFEARLVDANAAK
ncbi:hypothetical protein MPSEU_001012300 [Mayamaea pseudoterrestris]|nr:hypothetical protein MPSEU_001012300 [Mayamaea pseudoterrestris]